MPSLAKFNLGTGMTRFDEALQSLLKLPPASQLMEAAALANAGHESFSVTVARLAIRKLQESLVTSVWQSPMDQDVEANADAITTADAYAAEPSVASEHILTLVALPPMHKLTAAARLAQREQVVVAHTLARQALEALEAQASKEGGQPCQSREKDSAGAGGRNASVEETRPPEQHRSDTDLLLWAVRHAGDHSVLESDRWHHVALLFGLGSTSAAQLCRRAGVDPEEAAGGCLCSLEGIVKCPQHDCWCDSPPESQGEQHDIDCPLAAAKGRG